MHSKKQQHGDTVITVGPDAEDQCSDQFSESGEQRSALTKDVSCSTAAGPPSAAAAAGTHDAGDEGGSNPCLRGLANNLHYVTFMPLIIIGVLQDIDVVMAAGICVGIVCTLILVGGLLKRGGYIKVWPKKFDLFNLVLYGAMIPVGVLQNTWLLHWVSVWTNAGNALFMWATILLPCRNFVMDSVADRVPAVVVNHPLLRRMALLIACTWATALSVMTVAAIIPPATRQHPTNLHLMTILCGYVLGFGPLLVAMVLQHVISHIYRKRMRQEFEQHAKQQEEAAAHNQSQV